MVEALCSGQVLRLANLATSLRRLFLGYWCMDTRSVIGYDLMKDSICVRTARWRFGVRASTFCIKILPKCDNVLDIDFCSTTPLLPFL
jgi:hypothetical protein